MFFRSQLLLGSVAEQILSKVQGLLGLHHTFTLSDFHIGKKSDFLYFFSILKSEKNPIFSKSVKNTINGFRDAKHNQNRECFQHSFHECSHSLWRICVSDNVHFGKQILYFYRIFLGFWNPIFSIFKIRIRFSLFFPVFSIFSEIVNVCLGRQGP